MQTLDIVKEHPDNNRVLECAAEANSAYIVTEDKDLSRLGQYEGTRIVDVAEFMKILVRNQHQ